MKNRTMKNQKLSPREAEVANMICYELTFKEIGVHLGLSTATVITHVARIRKKLGVSNVAGVVREVVLNGWLDEESTPVMDTASFFRFKHTSLFND